MMWAVTSYFNPFGDRAREANFLAFRRTLPLPLLTVSMGNSQAYVFAGTYRSGDRQVFVDGDLMWQKERLYNIALQHLPDDCDKVVFVDADILAPESDIWEETSAWLNRHPVVQPFEKVEYLAADGTVDYTWPSIAATGGKLFGQGAKVAMGNAWAFRRDFISSIGFHDKFIVGGGDMPLVAALYNMPTEVVAERAQLNSLRMLAFDQWCQFVKPVKPAFAHGTIQHLWHGSESSRRYHERKAILRDFDPFRDISAADGEGFRWADRGARVSAMALRIESYFKARTEKK